MVSQLNYTNYGHGFLVHTPVNNFKHKISKMDIKNIQSLNLKRAHYKGFLAFFSLETLTKILIQILFSCFDLARQPCLMRSMNDPRILGKN